MSWIEVHDYGTGGWQSSSDSSQSSRHYCEQLEQGRVLLFSRPPFSLTEEDRQFLLGQRAGDSRLHKNISYRPQEDSLRGFSDDKETTDRVHQILRNYSRQVTKFVSDFLVPYAGKFNLDFASFRPLEEEGRDLPLHKRNDLLHVDAFPSRPTHGGRILRVFTNIHASKERVWLTGEPFDKLASSYAMDAGLQKFAGQAGGLRSRVTGLLHATGLPVADRSAYDEFMLHFHDYLKENRDYQSAPGQVRMTFPPMATWLVFTDGVPHAALSGQSALEQTFIVPRDALVSPVHSPIQVLENLCGRKLAGK